MTPLEFTRDLAADLTTRGAPPESHAQLGEIIVPCAGTYVSIVNQVQVDLGNNCAPIELVDVVAVLARDCANVSNDDGTTNWTAQDQVSAGLDADGAMLWDWGEKLLAAAWYRTGTPTLTYTILGGIAMVTLGIQLPLP